MGHKVGMVHAGCSNVRIFNELIAEIMPGVEVVHLVDEGLPVMSSQHLHGQVVRRLKALSSFAEESGAEVVLITCTAFGRLADEVGRAVQVPVLSVFEIVINEAMGMCDHINIIATHPDALESAARIIKEQAIERGQKIQLKTQLCSGAFEALRGDDMATYDRIVMEHLSKLMDETGLILVPQPSMEGAIKRALKMNCRENILTSAELSVRRLKDKLDGLS